MGRRIFVRWAVAARRFAPDWLLSLVVRTPCQNVAYKEPEDDGRAIRIGEACPHCLCELVDLGKHGSPGRVRNPEKLHSIVIAPTDLDKTALAITMITHAEKKGMSVLRGVASDDEFRTIIKQRLKKPSHSLHGVATFDCSTVRDLVAEEATDQRNLNDRLYYVLDTDMANVPNHADIFATVPSPVEGKTAKAAWRSERERLLDLLIDGFSSPADFRDGVLVQ